VSGDWDDRDDPDYGREYDEGEAPWERGIDGVGFAQEGSALRAATRDNPRDQPCPSCGGANRLTRIDVMRHYQCDSCADRAERGYD
jgi:hypothetical protein